jgi:hypothetical protein
MGNAQLDERSTELAVELEKAANNRPFQAMIVHGLRFPLAIKISPR